MLSIYSKSEFNSLGLTAQHRELCFVSRGFIRLKVPLRNINLGWIRI